MIEIGSQVIYKDQDNNTYKGTVVDNIKLPEDICVLWDTGQIISYDKEWILENCTIEAL